MAYFVHHAHTALAELAKDLVFARNDYCHRRSCNSPPLVSLRLFCTLGSSLSVRTEKFHGFPSLSPSLPYHNLSTPVRQALPQLFHEFLGVTEDRLEHLPREPAGEGILLAGVVGAKERSPVQGESAAVPETGDWRGNRQPQLAPGSQIGGKSNLPESDHHTHLFEQGKFLQQVRPASDKFFRQGFIIRWSTVDRSRNIAISQL